LELLDYLNPDFLFISLLFSVFSVACDGGSRGVSHEQKKAESPNREFRKKPPSSFHDSLLIELRSATFFEPDSLQMEEIKTANGKMIFESLTHDCFYQMQNARKVLDMQWKGLPVMQASKIRWLIFRKSNGTDSIIDLNNVNFVCGMYLFDPEKNPIRADMTNVETQLNFYFQKN
jgi:hypothetical protein